MEHSGSKGSTVLELHVLLLIVALILYSRYWGGLFGYVSILLYSNYVNLVYVFNQISKFYPKNLFKILIAIYAFHYFGDPFLINNIPLFL